MKPTDDATPAPARNNGPREHHYVPQFYLRHFSDTKKTIGLFHLPSRKVVASAPIKSQCARRQFHAFDPGLEQRIGTMEAAAAPVIQACLDRGIPPARNSPEWATLLSFAVLQKLRTVRAATANSALMTGLSEFVEETSGKTHEPSKDPVSLSILQAPDISQTACDLAMHLFVNGTSEEFLTSDDPLVLHNAYSEAVTHRGVLGWRSRGLQAFLPLSPTVTLMLYDASVYAVEGSKRGLASTISLASDVRALNRLQILNAHEHVYSRAAIGERLTDFISGARTQRPEGRAFFAASGEVLEPGGASSRILHSFEQLLPIALSLSQVGVRKRWRKIPPLQRAGLYRHGQPPTVSVDLASPMTRYPVSRTAVR